VGADQGRFWPIFGAYLLAVTLAVVVYLLGYAVILGIVAAVGGGAGASRPWPTPTLSSMSASSRRPPIQTILGGHADGPDLARHPHAPPPSTAPSPPPAAT